MEGSKVVLLLNMEKEVCQSIELMLEAMLITLNQ